MLHCPNVFPWPSFYIAQRESYSRASHPRSTILPSCTPTASGKRCAPELSSAAPLDGHHHFPFYRAQRSGKTNMWVPKQGVAHTLRCTMCDMPLSVRSVTPLLTFQTSFSYNGICSAIEYWSAAKRDASLSLESLRSFLLSLDLEPSLDDLAIRKNLICRIDWDTGSKPIEGLVAAIKDDLVCFGASKGIDSYQSEKVLDTLLRRVADLLSADGERRLAYVDFVREFDGATRELVSREESVTSVP